MSKPKLKTPADFASVEIDVTFDDLELDEGHLELSDADFELIDTAAPAPVSRSILRAALAVPEPISSAELLDFVDDDDAVVVDDPKPVRRAMSSRLSWDADAESDVADECLATIAAEASRARLGSDPFLSISLSPLPPASSSIPIDLSISRMKADLSRLKASLSSRPTPAMPPPSSSSVVGLVTRLPPVSSPPFRSPFARTSQTQMTAAATANDDCVETLPVPLKPFARTVPDGVPSPAHPTPRGDAPSGSVAPVALGKTGGTVIVFPDRQRTAWVIASAAVGALVAVTAMRLITGSVTTSNNTAAVDPAAEAAAVAQPIPATPIVAPPQAKQATPHAPAAVVRFTEADGVSIKVPSAAATPPPATPAPPAPEKHVAAAPAPAPTPATHAAAAAPARNAKAAPPVPKVSAPMSMPDGTLGLANNKSTTPTTPAAPPVAAGAAPRSGPKQLTPEQELAEAQLRAALR